MSNNVTIIDSRVHTAREYLAEGLGEPEGVEKVLSDLLDYAEERLKINVGLIAENGTLKKKIGNDQPDTIDLSTVSTEDLMDAIKERVK